ncbi:MAG: sodium-dependent transporter, partial [Spirochaetaceae bacterium]|nr:sodium-dependent transporter [Spirochaetaceae bacterium]
MKERESLASRLGFILLSAGCAIGLGNVWRFPYITGKYGGALFVLVYLFFLIALGLPIMVMEFSVGRASRQNVGKAFKTLEPKGTKWHAYGHIAIAGNYILMMFYATISGWLLYYCFASLTGQFHGLDTAAVGAFFGSLTTSPGTQFLWMAIAVVLSFVIVGIGLEKGVEKITKVMMILLILLIVVLAVNSLLL